MFKINNETKLIELTRGDEASIMLSITDYTFVANDKVRLAIYNAKAMEKPPVLEKTYTINESAEEVELYISEEESKFGEMKSKPIDYWYEIELNGKETVIGYDDQINEDSKKGEKIFRLFPEGYESGV